MRPFRRVAIVSLALFAIVAHTSARCADPEPQAEPAGIKWSALEEPEQHLVTKLLEGPHWPFRAIGLLRLERYEGENLENLIRARIADEHWQVRCFALRQAHRLNLEINPEALAKEQDGRVIRAALRYGVKLPPERIERGARLLLRNAALDELMLGLEIAALTDHEPIRREANRRLQRLMREMDAATLLRIDDRLARVVGLSRTPNSIEAWQEWARGKGDNMAIAAADQVRGSRSLLELNSIIRNLDGETFSRLMDYLDILRARDLDLVIVMDATSSMLPMINETRAGVESLILFLNDISRTMRLAFVAYRDHDNEPVWDGLAFTGDVVRIRNFLFGLRISGGADLPEAVLDGLTACGKLNWNRTAAREIILVGDARPHDEDEYKIVSLLENFRTHGVVTHSVHVPMEFNEIYRNRMSPDAITAYQREIADHNVRTKDAFAQIAKHGGGESVALSGAGQLVPSIMHLILEDAWWPAFDEFYARYLELCR